jgi:hypothetical protein
MPISPAVFTTDRPAVFTDQSFQTVLFTMSLYRVSDCRPPKARHTGITVTVKEANLEQIQRRIVLEVERNGGKLPQEYKITGCATGKPKQMATHGLGKHGKIIVHAEPDSKQQDAPSSDQDIQLTGFKILLCAWILCAHVAFHQGENIHFRNLLYYLNSRVQDLLPDTADTVRNWVMERYHKQRDEVSAALRESPFRIHSLAPALRSTSLRHASV